MRRNGSWFTAAIIAAVACLLLAIAWDQVVNTKPETTAPPEVVKTIGGKTASNTHTTVRHAPRDPSPTIATTGIVVHPTETVGIFDKPNGKQIGVMPARQFGDTWLPAIARAQGWMQVLLPSKPNGSTGWLKTATLKQGHTPYVVRVHLKSRELVLYRDKQVVGGWKVAVGAKKTPTPTGRTFVLGQFTDPKQKYSDVFLPLGAHSPTLDTFGGGPGTVAIHGWKDASVFGKAISHGCIRVPDEALFQLRQVPIGTIVLIDAN